MAQLIVRKLEDDVKERLRARARRNGRSLEAEARDILERTVAREKPSKPAKQDWVTDLSGRMQEIGVTTDDVAELQRHIAELRRDWRAREVISRK